ncbi:gliding motility-associated C-terminal domain-containing protein [Zeaxanthinibacter enoshimensis]|uniref:gliding motility-associated C-terminal domain-containing protein n=1 Tax=Zeaxanthinibacter enoshimensis TaxID=392009 RepID=UPI0035621D7B
MTNLGFIFIAIIIVFGDLSAQTALYNSGNIRIHNGGIIGFHTDLVNDGSFDENRGLAGFYGTSPLTLSGAFMPFFYDTEWANDSGVDLQTPVSVTNNANFIIGDVRTPRDMRDVFLNFTEDGFYNGDSDFTKVDGYVSVTGQASFSFPVGTPQQLRPLVLNSDGPNPLAKCAYFAENPNNPSTFPPFNTEIRAQTISGISQVEFWRLEGSVPSTITLSWNPSSGIAALAPELEMLTIMGWSKQARRWVSLGHTVVSGDLENGFISSASFIPDEYEIITYGSLAEPSDILALPNYILTPNNDGINDFLRINELEQSPNNSLALFDRNGLLVFKTAPYQNNFAGFSNVDNLVINREQGLPEGIYYYVLELFDLGLQYQGFLYLER